MICIRVKPSENISGGANANVIAMDTILRGAFKSPNRFHLFRTAYQSKHKICN